ncbi:MAG: extracellular solute-binding protein [Rhizobiaceae bacterium]
MSWTLTRRDFLAGAAALVTAGRPAFAATPRDTPLHGLSAFGELKYGAGFTHFDYARPEAPNGGTFRFSPPSWAFNQNVTTFNTLNSFVARGDAPPRMELCFASLMSRAIDEPDAVYGLLAESVMVSGDGKTYTFRLRPGATFHDGTPITAGDVAFTCVLLKAEGHPSLQLPLKPLAEAVADDETTLRLVFDGTQDERDILTLVEYPVLSKADIEANGFDTGSLRPLLGSGPYRVGAVAPGLSITYERVKDWWGDALGVARGQMHFAAIRIEVFRERQAGFEAFKKGEVHFRQEFTSKLWATAYDFPAITDGKVIRREFPAEKRPSMQAWALNRRRARFDDVRVREAIGLCFDFEWTRQNFFYGSYERSQSLFERSAYRAEGMPTADELKLLEPLRGRVPDEAFGDAVTQPVSDGSGRDRALLRQAHDLLRAAGFRRDGSSLVDGKGERLAVEILVNDETFVRIDTPFVEAMKAVGIDASIRLVDPAQYQSRQNDFDFDMIAMAQSFSAHPTTSELGQVFSAASAALPGSRNLAGTADPAVDDLIATAGRAATSAELGIALRALDRVLRARRDWIPNWHAANHRAAFWDMFGFDEPKPDFGFPVETLWWLDENKARAIGML